MRQIAALSIVVFALLFAARSPVAAQDAKKEKKDDDSFTIHVRELTEPERVLRRRLAEADTVLEAVGSLKLPPEGLSKMDMWIARVGTDGEAVVLPIDWASIVEKGRTETNFQLLSRDRLILQVRLPK